MSEPMETAMGPLDEAIWRMPTVQARTGMGKNTIIRRVEADDFPKPVRIGERSIGWLASEVTAWIRSRPRASVTAIRESDAA